MSLVSFYTPWKYHKRDQWDEMSYRTIWDGSVKNGEKLIVKLGSTRKKISAKQKT